MKTIAINLFIADTIMLGVIVFIVLAMCSCQSPITYTASSGGKTETFKTWGMVGGSESFRTAGGFEWTGNRNKSFGQAAQAVASVSASRFASIASKSRDAASTAAAAEVTKQNADKLAAQTEQARIAAQTAATSEAINNGAAIAPLIITPPK